MENEYPVTDADGCATDPSIFGEWERSEDGSVLRVAFNAFKFPSSDNIRFQCNIRVCFGKCQPVINASNIFATFENIYTVVLYFTTFTFFFLFAGELPRCRRLWQATKTRSDRQQDVVFACRPVPRGSDRRVQPNPDTAATRPLASGAAA